MNYSYPQYAEVKNWANLPSGLTQESPAGWKVNAPTRISTHNTYPNLLSAYAIYGLYGTIIFIHDILYGKKMMKLNVFQTVKFVVKFRYVRAVGNEFIL